MVPGARRRGDALHAVARILRDAVREGGGPARMGGDDARREPDEQLYRVKREHHRRTLAENAFARG